MKKIMVIALFILCFAKSGLCYDVNAVCVDKDGEGDVYSFTFNNSESFSNAENQIYGFCADIGKLYVGTTEGQPDDENNQEDDGNEADN